MPKNEIAVLIAQYKSMSTVHALAYFLSLPTALIVIVLFSVLGVENGHLIPNETVAFSMDAVSAIGTTNNESRSSRPIRHLDGVEVSRECVSANGAITNCAAP